MKPIYKILIAIVLIAIIVGVIYFVWKRVAEPIQPTTSEEPGSFPTSTPTLPRDKGVTISKSGFETTLTKISDREALFTWVNSADESFYITEEGFIYLAKEGVDEQVSDRALSAINFVLTSPDYTKVLIASGNPLSPTFQIFDLLDKTWEPLGEDVLQATWGATSNELIAVAKGESANNLVSINLEKIPPLYKTILPDFKFLDTQLRFLTPQNVYIIEKPMRGYMGSVWKLDTKTLSIETLKDKKDALWISWTPNNLSAFIFEAPNKFTIADGKTLSSSIAIPFKSLPSKCSEQNGMGICFVPQNRFLEDPDVLLPDDYFQKKSYTNDEVILYNAISEDFYSLLSGNNSGVPPLDATSVVISSIGTPIYFINRYDDYVYQIKIKQINE